MKLFLLRHGHAEPFANTDAMRPLSARGEAEVRSTITSSKSDLHNIEYVWVSPYLRAQQTWQVASQIIEGSPAVITQPAIVPEGSVTLALKLIEESTVNSLLIVTHQPFVGSLLDGLCGFDAGRHFMGTAHLAGVELSLLAMGLGDLLWLRSPEV